MVRYIVIGMLALQLLYSPVVRALEPEQPQPMVRILPNYPVGALGREGQVTLTFRITEAGRADNIEVLSATPEGVFEQAAINALEQWIYRPIVLAGKPIIITMG